MVRSCQEQAGQGAEGQTKQETKEKAGLGTEENAAHEAEEPIGVAVGEAGDPRHGAVDGEDECPDQQKAVRVKGCWQLVKECWQ